MNAAEQLLAAWAQGSEPRDYRAANANRGTPPRKHDNLASLKVGEDVVLMTRGERKRTARRYAIRKIVEAAA